VAYRQLCAVTFAVLGLVAVGCGGGTSSAGATGATGEQPPTNPDQAPDNTNDTATNPDVAPTNPDAVPGSSEDTAGSGSGGRLTGLCKKLCSTLSTLADDCSNGMTMLGMEDACSAEVNCQIPANFPCQDEIADAFECLFDNLALICSPTTSENENQGPASQACQDVARKFTSCADAHDLGGDTDPGNGNGPGNQRSCTEAGGCECDSECLTCFCEAGTDADEQAACATTCATP
jgi:hypothetical protein